MFVFPTITMEIPPIHLKILEKNLQNLSDNISYRVIQTLVEAGRKTLETALPMTPWDTGRLRRSGTVTLTMGNFKRDLFKGTKSGNVKKTGKQPSVRQAGKILRRFGKAQVMVHYRRPNKAGDDLAIWAHEDLNPYGAGTIPSARKPGTGPKYLEKAFKQRKPEIMKEFKRIEEQIEQDIKRNSKKVTTRYNGSFAGTVVALGLLGILEGIGKAGR